MTTPHKKGTGQDKALQEEWKTTAFTLSHVFIFQLEDVVVTGGAGGFSVLQQGEQGWERLVKVKRKGQSCECGQ